MTVVSKAATGSELFEEIAVRLTAEPGVTRGKIFGLPCLKSDGKVFVAFWKDALVAKLPADRIAEAEASGASVRFASDSGRVMKGWTAFLPSTVEEWLQLAVDARAFVAGAA